MNLPRLQGSWGQHKAHLGPTGPRWVPCWPHELCYLGSSHYSLQHCLINTVSEICRLRINHLKEFTSKILCMSIGYDAIHDMTNNTPLNSCIHHPCLSSFTFPWFKLTLNGPLSYNLRHRVCCRQVLIHVICYLRDITRHSLIYYLTELEIFILCLHGYVNG